MLARTLLVVSAFSAFAAVAPVSADEMVSESGEVALCLFYSEVGAKTFDYLLTFPPERVEKLHLEKDDEILLAVHKMIMDTLVERYEEDLVEPSDGRRSISDLDWMSLGVQVFAMVQKDMTETKVLTAENVRGQLHTDCIKAEPSAMIAKLRADEQAAREYLSSRP